MYINATDSRIVVGRFSLLPGAKFPTVPMTEAEKKSIEAFLKKGLIVEKAGKAAEVATKVEEAVAKTASEVVAEAAAPVEAEAPVAEEPVEAPAEEPAKRGRKSKKD